MQINRDVYKRQDIEANPSVTTVEKATAKYLESGADFIDVYKRQNEGFYHGMMLGLCAILGNR